MTAGDTGLAYMRVARAIAAELSNSFWKTGDAIPSEFDLAAHFSVSRNTIRQALALLQSQGIVSKGQGRRTVVERRAIRTDKQHLTDFPSAAREAGFRPDTRLLSVRKMPAGLTEAHVLSLSVSEPVSEICRVRILEGRPAVRQVSIIPGTIADGLPLHALRTRSLYKLVRAHHVDTLVLASQHVFVAAASGREASDLKIDEGAPLLRIQRLVTDGEGGPVEYSDSVVRDDVFLFST
ncbi:GntR family transcriptional regulator [Chelativorans salis]|uniref:GntR family transcriptional regulator n=1 Tax=Chelativorans salis TaxID=2978478 RepID=A0ABT2LUX1_9HYPH|nr:GntR family transcriptional regulator [Chelativorans sp. EGI FJ00035]MCT7378321.1 GntR family transcriptional regulator [Chelativorans sp. EGI FJ00035]